MRAFFFVSLAACVALAVTGYEVQNSTVALPGSLGMTLDVYAPDISSQSNSAKTFPVIWFTTGFGCALPVSLYSKMIAKIVSEGYIVAGVYHAIPGVPAYFKDGQRLHDIMEWGKDNLATAMANASLNAVPDVVGRSAVMGQSAGNHIAGQALTVGCSVAKAFIMIDPVDGFDPYHIIKSKDLIGPNEKVKFNIPALLLDNGLDPRPANIVSPACAPAKISNDHFYNAWNGPIWNINATAYGHMDCTDNPTGFWSVLCSSDKKTDKDLYRSMLAEAATTFLGALFDNKPANFARLSNADNWKTNVVLKHDLKGKNYSQIKPGCVNVDPTSAILV